MAIRFVGVVLVVASALVLLSPGAAGAIDAGPGGAGTVSADAGAAPAGAVTPADAGSAETRPARLSLKNWCSDLLTFCWRTKAPAWGNDKGQKLKSFLKRAFSPSGIRLILEPSFGRTIQSGPNRFETREFDVLPAMGVELSWYQAYVSLHLQLIFPTTIEYDQDSPKRDKLEDKLAGRAGVDYGWAAGLSFFDGIIVVGYGRFKLTFRDFKDGMGDDLSEGFVFVNVQPASALRAAFKQAKK